MNFDYDVKPDEMDRLPPRQRDPLHGRRLRWEPPPAEPGDIALATWSIVALLGIALGVALTKYSQAWVRDTLHPGAALGAAMIVVSLCLVVTAAFRYLARDVGLLSPRRASRALAVLSVLLVVALAWAGLSIVWLAGWTFPPDATR